MFSESSAMSKCLSISQVTDTALDFLLCQHQSFNLGSSPGTADSISQQKIKPGAWASILVMQLIFFFFFFTMEMAYFAVKSGLLPSQEDVWKIPMYSLWKYITNLLQHFLTHILFSQTLRGRIALHCSQEFKNSIGSGRIVF